MGVLLLETFLNVDISNFSYRTITPGHNPAIGVRYMDDFQLSSGVRHGVPQWPQV
jgi:hypothetical protein